MSKRKTTKPKARTLKATWTLGKKRVSKKRIKINASYLIQVPPPAMIVDCPRCGETHEKSEPQKFLKPMQFFSKDKKGKEVLTAQCSHWQPCPKTKEPIIFFDRFIRPDQMEQYVVSNLAEDIARQEDQRFLAEIRSIVENTKATNKPPFPDEIRVELLETKDKKKTKTQTWAWVYDPNAPERMVKGTPEQAAEQRARVLAQEAKAKPLIEKERRKARGKK